MFGLWPDYEQRAVTHGNLSGDLFYKFAFLLLVGYCCLPTVPRLPGIMVITTSIHWWQHRDINIMCMVI